MAKKTKKKAPKKAKAKKKTSSKCEAKRCRKEPLSAQVFCEKHAKKNDAQAQVLKLEINEALRFGKLDAEIKNHLQGIKLAEYEIQSIKRQFQDRIKAQMDHQAQLKLDVARVKPLYDDLLGEISKRYDIPTANLLIDPDSRTIRDSRTDL